MRRLMFLTTMLASVIVLDSCYSKNKILLGQTEALFRNKWRLTEVQGQPVPESMYTSFEFTQNNLTGSTGCNSLSARFMAGSHQSVTILPDTPTNKTCENANAADLEAKFLDALSKTTNWSINEGELRLKEGDITLIKMRSL